MTATIEIPFHPYTNWGDVFKSINSQKVKDIHKAKVKVKPDADVEGRKLIELLVLLIFILLIVYALTKTKKENSPAKVLESIGDEEDPKKITQFANKEFGLNIEVVHTDSLPDTKAEIQNPLDEYFGMWKGRGHSLDKIREGQWE